jgi:hypothetical protein
MCCHAVRYCSYATRTAEAPCTAEKLDNFSIMYEFLYSNYVQHSKAHQSVAISITLNSPLCLIKDHSLETREVEV